MRLTKRETSARDRASRRSSRLADNPWPSGRLTSVRNGGVPSSKCRPISAIEREANVETLNQTLAQRVDKLLESHHHERLLTTTGTRAAVEELSQRNEGLEKIVRELALEVEGLSAAIAELRAPSNYYTVSVPRT
jgi:hypothetical protein